MSIDQISYQETKEWAKANGVTGWITDHKYGLDHWIAEYGYLLKRNVLRDLTKNECSGIIASNR